MDWFPILLGAHIALAVSLLLPSVLLPIMVRRSAGSEGGVTHLLMAVQGTGTLVIGLGLALTGAAMLWILGPELATQPWLMVALGLYAANLVIAGFVSRPNLRRLIGLPESGVDETTWRRRARRQRLIAYGMAGVIGVIGFLMTTKPSLW